jgi:hypothetical protein
MTVDTPDQVWCADITYIPMRRGFLYLVAIMDWYSRRFLAWRLAEHDGSGLLHRSPRGAMAQVRPPDDRRPSARYMTLESVGQLSDDPLISLLAVAR